MRAFRFVLILLTILAFGGPTSFSLLAVARADPGFPAPFSSRSTPATATMVADAGNPGARAAKGEDLEHLPQQGIREDDSPVGTVLIIAAVVVFGVIVGFIIRHHGSGRAG